MRKLSLLSLALLVYPLFSAAQTTPDSTIARLEAINRDIWIPFSEAYAAANAEQYIGLHSPDFIRASGGIPGNIFDLEKYAENSRAGFQRGKERGFKTQIRFTFIERIVSAKFASERGIYHYHSDNGKGESYDAYGKFHVVERFENGRWKILFDYDSNENGTIDKGDFDAGFALDNWSILSEKRN
ncbi:MAG: nuclear transport factor 2 family protein [Lewinellaceae bacterium]|nr:nuclear transport factor 2 family protein [Lewinellaceae bacterium]